LWIHQVYDYVNALRDLYNTDWAFVVFLVDSSNDSDGYFEGGGGPECTPGGPSIRMTRDNGKVYIGFDGMGKVMAHETGNIFWAIDEDGDISANGGYLNSSNNPHSGCVMDNFPNAHWCVSNGTRSQIGWTDTDSDGIPDILDTFPSVFINSTNILGRKISITGNAKVNPYPNLGKVGSGRNVTINKIQSVQYRIDNGTWLNATITPTEVRKLVRYPSTYEYKNTTAIVDFNFTTEELEPGDHFIELRAVNSVGNMEYANTTGEISAFLPTDLNQDGKVNIQDITIVAVAYHTKPGDNKWNPLADLDKSNFIDIIDISMVAKDYGKTT
jgi:hypothetical protein